MTPQERLLSRVSPEPNTGCWLWTGATTYHGYGQLGKTRAHRVSYEMFVGPILAGLVIDHLCRQRCCVNPAHLEPVTNRVNSLRGIGFGAKNARKTACPYGHPYTHLTHDGHRGCRLCERKKNIPVLRRHAVKQNGTEPLCYRKVRSEFVTLFAASHEAVTCGMCLKKLRLAQKDGGQ